MVQLRRFYHRCLCDSVSLNKVPLVMSTLCAFWRTNLSELHGFSWYLLYFTLVFFSGLKNLFDAMFVRSAGPQYCSEYKVMQTDGKI